MLFTDVSVVTQRGILVQSGMTQNIVSTASQSQSRKPAMHIADGQSEGRNTIPSKSSLLPHTDVDGIVSSSLTDQSKRFYVVSAEVQCAGKRGSLSNAASIYSSESSWYQSGNNFLYTRPAFFRSVFVSNSSIWSSDSHGLNKLHSRHNS